MAEDSLTVFFVFSNRFVWSDTFPFDKQRARRQNHSAAWLRASGFYRWRFFQEVLLSALAVRRPDNGYAINRLATRCHARRRDEYLGEPLSLKRLRVWCFYPFAALGRV